MTLWKLCRRVQGKRNRIGLAMPRPASDGGAGRKGLNQLDGERELDMPIVSLTGRLMMADLS